MREFYSHPGRGGGGGNFFFRTGNYFFLRSSKVVTFHCQKKSHIAFDFFHQAMRTINYVSLYAVGWFATVGAFRSSLLFRLNVDTS